MLRTIDYSTYKSLQQIQEPFSKEQLDSVQTIIKDVKNNKDQALIKYTKQFDGVLLDTLRVTTSEIDKAFRECDPILVSDLEIAYKNILKYHQKQKRSGYEIEVSANSYIGQKITPIDSVGIYVPGGTAAYPSTVLMNTAPAKLAGVKRIVMISPPTNNGTISPIILVAATIAGIDEIYTVGGAQGIAALAYGTESIKPVNKIVGPGNIYVAIAKKEVFGTVGIDMIAGPSEILIYADQTSNPSYIAADLLSQAEHDTLARPILVTTEETIISLVNEELEKQLKVLSRQTIARQSLQQFGVAIFAQNEEEAVTIINDIAPEHLELLNQNRLSTLERITNAGAIFIGEFSPEPLGDYIAGPNHTLPTSGTAKFSSPLSVDDFVTKTSIINYSKETLSVYKDSIIRIATKEGLIAHANAVKVRFENES